MRDKTLLYQISETSKYMMGFVIVTRKNNVIVIDGGKDFDIEKIYYNFPSFALKYY